MFYLLVKKNLLWLTAHKIGFLRVFTFVTFQAILAVMVSFLIVYLLAPGVIRWLRAQKIGDNAKGSSGGTTTPSTPETKKADAGASKKLQLDDFLLKDVKVNLVLPGGAGTVPLPKFDIHLQKLGQGADGITGAEVVTAMIGAILEKAGPLAADAIKNGIGNVGKEATKQLDKVTKGVGNLFK